MAKKKGSAGKMKKFILIYHSPLAAMELMAKATPEEQAKGMEPWMAWSAKCGDHLLDMGAPLALGLKVDKSGIKQMKPKNDLITGYSIMQAENIDTIKKLVDNHPHVNWTEGCWLEIHEMTQM